MLKVINLTARQREIYAFVELRQRTSGFAPSVQEIAGHFGFKSQNSVRQHLRLIEKKGFIKRERGLSRALTVTDRSGAGIASIRVPIMGRIAAGRPILAAEERDSAIELPESLFRGSELFALRVHGDSMSGIGILDGDLAVLDSVPEVRNGAIGGVQIEDEATLKRIYRNRQGLVLKSENPSFPEIVIRKPDSRQIRVIGALIGILRTIL